MYYLDLDDKGYLKGYFTVDTPTEAIPEDSPLSGVPAVESLEGLDLSDQRYRAHHWDGEKLVLDEDRLAEVEIDRSAASNEEPTPFEQLRADVDFIAAMTGVIL